MRRARVIGCAASKIEARARALAERTLRGSFIGNPRRHAEIAAIMPAGAKMPRLLDENEILAQVDRDWPLYAELIEDGIV